MDNLLDDNHWECLRTWWVRKKAEFFRHLTVPVVSRAEPRRPIR
jgi:hypothetical protein